MYNFYPKLIYKLYAIPIKTLPCLLRRPGNLILKFIWREKDQVKALLKNNVSGMYLPNTRIYHKLIVIKCMVLILR